MPPPPVSIVAAAAGGRVRILRPDDQAAEIVLAKEPRRIPSLLVKPDGEEACRGAPARVPGTFSARAEARTARAAHSRRAFARAQLGTIAAEQMEKIAADMRERGDAHSRASVASWLVSACTCNTRR